MNASGARPQFRVIHMPECAELCTLLKPLPSQAARQRAEEVRIFNAGHEPTRSDPAWHEAACLCEACQRDRR